MTPTLKDPPRPRRFPSLPLEIDNASDPDPPIRIGIAGGRRERAVGVSQKPVATLGAVRVLGVDLGSKRIGLAISDEEEKFAFPAGILNSRGRKLDLGALRKLIAEKQIGRAVVGLPIHMDGRRGPEAEKAIRFATDLSKTARIPVDTLDERWTSREAERLMRPASGKRGARARKQGAIDEMAASIILRTYLDQQRPDEVDPSDQEVPEQ